LVVFRLATQSRGRD